MCLLIGLHLLMPIDLRLFLPTQMHLSMLIDLHLFLPTQKPMCLLILTHLLTLILMLIERLVQTYDQNLIPVLSLHSLCHLYR